MPAVRVDTSSWLSGAVLIGDPGFGVAGSAVPSSGPAGPGYVYDQLILPADAAKEVCGRITSWPSAGTLYAYEDSSFTFTGAPDGSYTFDYQLYLDGVATGSPITVTLNIGGASLTIQDAVHAHAADSIGLTTRWLLNVADALHAHAAESPAVSTALLLAIADAAHAHVADNLTVDPSNAIHLLVSDALHAHADDGVTLTTASTLQIVDALHAHLADAVVLDLNNATLIIATAQHAHMADVVLLALPNGVLAAARIARSMQTSARPAQLSTGRRTWH